MQDNVGPCVDHREKHTFQDRLKTLSTNCQLIFDSNERKIIFNRQGRDFYKHKALAWALSL